MGETTREPMLVELPARVPDGFVYRPDFLSETEEYELIREIENIHLEPFKYYQFTGKRRTASFGWEYEFGERDIRRGADLPPFLLPFRSRAAKLFDLNPDSLSQVSFIEYSVGSPIGWHRDIPHFGVVIGISLGSTCRMRFRKYPSRSKKRERDEILSIELMPRSVYLLSGAARETWQHSIPPVKALRYAIMMRTLRAKDR